MYRILVVDDDRSVVEVLEKFLVSKGFKVRKAYNGRQALDILKKKELDLIILDEELPGMSGLTFLEEMKRLEKDIPVVVLTGSDESIQLLKKMKIKKDHLLFKPVHLASLLKTINKILVS